MRELFLYGENASSIDANSISGHLQQQFKQMPLHEYKGEVNDFLRLINRLGLEYVRT